MREEARNYLINLIPNCEQTIRIRNNRILVYYCRTKSFKDSLFIYILKDWFSLENSIKSSETILTFKNRLLSFIHPVQNNIFNIFDPIGLKFLTRLWLGFSHLNAHIFWHNYQNCMNPLSSCSLEIEDTLHYLLNCHLFNHFRIRLMNNVKSVVDNSESQSVKDKKRYTFIWWLRSRQNQK